MRADRSHHRRRAVKILRELERDGYSLSTQHRIVCMALCMIIARQAEGDPEEFLQGVNDAQLYIRSIARRLSREPLYGMTD